jgi:hypothetical protein
MHQNFTQLSPNHHIGALPRKPTQEKALMLPEIATYLPAFDIIIVGGIGVVFAGAVLLYGRRHEQWSRQRNTPR